MPRQKSIESYNEDIQKVESQIDDLQDRIRKKRAELKELEEGKRAAQGTALLEKFWEKDITDFEAAEGLLEKLLDKVEKPSSEQTDVKEEHNHSNQGGNEV